MELNQDTPLTLSLFLLNDSLAERDPEQPDLTLSVILTETLLANLCQNPAPEQSISIPLEVYDLEVCDAQFSAAHDVSHAAQLILNHGPVLNAVLTLGDEQLFVSPPLEMMPTFDLGLDDDSEEVPETTSPDK